MQFDGLMLSGMLSKEPEADLLLEHRHSDPNDPRHKSHAVMLVDLPRPNILHLQVDRLHKVPVQSTRLIDPRTLPMIKSSSPLVDSLHRSLNEGADDLLLVDSNETDPFDELLVKPIYPKMRSCLSVHLKGDQLRIYSIYPLLPISLDHDLGRETLRLLVV
jgi:hypothetical protein